MRLEHWLRVHGLNVHVLLLLRLRRELILVLVRRVLVLGRCVLVLRVLLLGVAGSLALQELLVWVLLAKV